MEGRGNKFVENPFKIEERRRKARDALSEIDSITDVTNVYLDPTILANGTFLETKWLDEHLYSPALVIKEEQGVLTLKLSDSNVVKTKPNCDSIKVVTKIDIAGVKDMLLLSNFSEQSMLHTLRVRYERNEIYTFVGSVLISINPYKTLAHLYTIDAMAEYHNNRAVSTLLLFLHTNI